GKSRTGRGIRALRNRRLILAGNRCAARDPVGERRFAPAPRARAIPRCGRSHRAHHAFRGQAMSRFGSTSVPERLRSAGGTEFERRLLDAAANEQPSRELCERMALGIGVAPPLTPVENGIPDPGVAAPTAATGARALLPWISATVVVAVVGAIV